METACGSLLNELQIIWNEVGESDSAKDRMLLELEQECLEVYRRKVDQANKCRAQLRQAIADAEAELAVICAAMGERPVHIRQSDQNTGSLNAELRAILPQIEEMRKRKCDRKNQFIDILEEIQKLKNEIYRAGEYSLNNTAAVDESDLSSRKLEELHRELQALQTEKSERLKKVLDHLNTLYTLCSVLGMDFKQTVSEIHTSLGQSEGSKNISNETIQQLGVAIHGLKELKLQRIQQLQDLAASLLELWNLMDTPLEEQQMFQKVTCCVAASEDEINEPEMLSADFINYVKAEVSRLEEFKSSKMKELVLKKKAELEDICRKTRLILETDNSLDIAVDAIESGAVDATYVLEQIELQIGRVKEEALSRKEILEKVDKWMAAREEESWLEEYDRDDNRYNAGRGAHLSLKRAEKARVMVNKLPAMVETLASKTIAWESEKGIDFTYDGVRLLSLLEGYTIFRKEKELEHKRQRDMKKLQGQLLTEQEALYGSKPSPMKNQSGKKGPRMSCGGASSRRVSLGGPTLQPYKPEKATPNTRGAKKTERVNHRDDGFVAISSGKRGLDHLLSALEVDSPMKNRKPFSPISSTDSTMSNATNIVQDANKKHNDMLQKKLLTINANPVTTPSKTISTMPNTEMLQKKLLLTTNANPFTTPSKTISISTTEDENKTPQTMPIPVPSTPSTVSIPMQTALTPARAAVKSVEEEIEYSFEERRAGFVLPRSSHVMKAAV